MLVNFTLCFLGALGISLLFIPFLQKVAQAKGLFDLPDHRKQHVQPTPSLGGLAIFAGFLGMVILFVEVTQVAHFHLLLLLVSAIVMVGLYDDLFDMRASRKAFFQVMIISLLFFYGYRLEGLEGIPYLDHFSPLLSYFATVLFFMLLINAYNLIDGIDGLAGSLTLYANLVFAWLFYAAGSPDWSLLALALSAATLGFLRYNFHKASIFMGDSGSMFLGLMIGIFSVQYLQCCGPETAGTSNLLIIMAIVIIP
ncbi:MAG: MraY family glycosyltransferase, partial [Bacteroidota bacterium]